jgi:hypothetical protein
MKLHSAALFTLKKALALLSLATLSLLATGAPPSAGRPTRPDPAPVRTTLWHAGNFRYLTAEAGSLHDYVDGLVPPYRPEGGYGKVSSARAQRFNLFLDVLFAAIDDSLDDGLTGDWCGVRNKAAEAGYEVVRYYDTVSGRWFVRGRDATSFGQAYFFINPFAKRNLVIEVPHNGYEPGTALEGARLFTSTAARALIINKEDRCSDPQIATCNFGSSKACDDDRLRESDVAHNTDNTFHLLHVKLNDADPAARFVQLHGFHYDAARHSQKVIIGDGTKTDVRTNSVSVLFADNLAGLVSPSPASAVGSCQKASGDPSPALCGESNAQARYTDNGDACTFTTNYRPRFLHVEQAATLRDGDESGDGMSWLDVRDALILTWGDCNMNNGATDCTLGPAQTQYSPWTCP